MIEVTNINGTKSLWSFPLIKDMIAKHSTSSIVRWENIIKIEQIDCGFHVSCEKDTCYNCDVAKTHPQANEVNAGYIITDRLNIGDTDFVIGYNYRAPAQYVTWICSKNKNDYSQGHYLPNRFAAIENLCHRILNEINYLRFLSNPNPKKG